MKAQLAFYVAKNGDWTDKLIAWWTDSKYSHVELVLDGTWYSTSPRDLAVRAKQIVAKEEYWDFVEVEVDKVKVVEFYEKTKGAKYDWVAIVLSQIVELDRHSKSKYICSEWCAEAIGLSNGNEYSPGDLYRKLVK